MERKREEGEAIRRGKEKEESDPVMNEHWQCLAGKRCNAAGERGKERKQSRRLFTTKCFDFASG